MNYYYEKNPYRNLWHVWHDCFTKEEILGLFWSSLLLWEDNYFILESLADQDQLDIPIEELNYWVRSNARFSASH